MSDVFKRDTKHGHHTDIIPFFNKSSPAIEEEEEGEDNAPLSLRFPTESIKRMLFYIISMPAMILLCLTLPDVKNKDFTITPSFKIPGKIY